MRHTLPAVFTLSLLAGCAGTPRITALHDPLYRAQAHQSTITATATETRDGINQIRIDAIVGELTACSNGALPSMMPCRARAATITATCGFASARTPVSCTLPIQTGNRRLITYTATTTNARGRTATAPTITYAAGAPLTEARVNIGAFSFTLPWETARPVWWRTAAPGSTGTPADSIDIGFFPDADFGTDYNAFTAGLQTIALGAFFTDANQFSSFYRFWKGIFNLWAGPAGADGEGCSRSFAGWASNIASLTDGDAILHRNAFRDCASIALGGAGTTEVGLGDAAWVFTHEAGHFLHGLGDEYVGGGNSAVSDPKNVFANQSSCQTASTAEGLPSGQCAQIGTTGTWRNDDGQATTMEDRVLTSDWRTLSGRALGRMVGRCNSGNCY